MWCQCPNVQCPSIICQREFVPTSPRCSSPHLRKRGDLQLSKWSSGPLMCVSVLLTEGGRRWRERVFFFSPSISTVLVPLANTRPLGGALPECRAEGLSRAVVAEGDRETGFHLGAVSHSSWLLSNLSSPYICISRRTLQA